MARASDVAATVTQLDRLSIDETRNAEPASGDFTAKVDKPVRRRVRKITSAVEWRVVKTDLPLVLNRTIAERVLALLDPTIEVLGVVSRRREWRKPANRPAESSSVSRLSPFFVDAMRKFIRCTSIVAVTCIRYGNMVSIDSLILLRLRA